jgi:hypothetical protein
MLSQMKNASWAGHDDFRASAFDGMLMNFSGECQERASPKTINSPNTARSS